MCGAYWPRGRSPHILSLAIMRTYVMARKPVKSAQQANASWVSAMGQASQAYINGVNAVQQSPGASAATPDAMQAYQNGVAQSIASGKRAASLQFSTQSWQQACAQKGAQRISTGAQAASGKQLQVAQKMQPIWQQMRDAAAAVPGGRTRGNAMQRWDAAMQVMYNAMGK